jgi:HSP20 family protein
MSTLSLWSRPFAFDREFDSFVRRAFAPTTGFTPAADVSRDGDDAVVRLELPGLDVAKDVEVSVDGDRLVVRGERRDEHSEERDGATVREVRYGSFQRSFTLPAHVSADAVTASYDAGVLSVRVAGAHTAAPGARRIPVTGSAPAAVESGADDAGATTEEKAA